MTETFSFPWDPDLQATADVLDRDPISGLPTPAVTFVANYAGASLTDPLVSPGQFASHVHDWPGTVQDVEFATPHMLDAANPDSPATFGSITRHRGRPDGYGPIAWWPGLVAADGTPVRYTTGLPVYHTRWAGAPSFLVAPPSGTGYVIRNKINGSIQPLTAPNSGKGYVVFGPKWWNGQPRADDHTSHTSRVQTAEHTIPIAQVQFYVKVHTPGPWHWLNHHVDHVPFDDPQLGHADYVYAYRHDGLLQWLYDLSINADPPRKLEAVRFSSLTPDAPQQPDSGVERARAEILIARDALNRALEHLPQEVSG